MRISDFGKIKGDFRIFADRKETRWIIYSFETQINSNSQLNSFPFHSTRQKHSFSGEMSLNTFSAFKWVWILLMHVLTFADIQITLSSIFTKSQIHSHYVVNEWSPLFPHHPYGPKKNLRFLITRQKMFHQNKIPRGKSVFLKELGK